MIVYRNVDTYNEITIDTEERSKLRIESQQDNQGVVVTGIFKHEMLIIIIVIVTF